MTVFEVHSPPCYKKTLSINDDINKTALKYPTTKYYENSLPEHLTRIHSPD